MTSMCDFFVTVSDVMILFIVSSVGADLNHILLVFLCFLHALKKADYTANVLFLSYLNS